MAVQKDEMIFALSLEDFSEYYKRADKLRREAVGDIVHIRAILEFSNYCRRNCAYCGLNCKNRALARYRMEPEEIIKTGKEAHRAGYKTIVLQSGEDSYYTREMIGEIVSELTKEGITVTLSCGERDFDEYRYWRDCGAARYLLKHETADEKLYAELHPGYTLEQRIACLKELKNLGYETGSGFMIGLPGENAELISENVLFLDKLNCDMAGIGPFIPSPMTEMANVPAGSVELTQRAVALTRILRPNMNLPATTALGVQNAVARQNVFSRGANVIMRKVTPEPYKSLYQIYPAKLGETDIVRERQELCDFIKSMGKIPE